MTEPYDSFEHAGLIVEIIQDDDPDGGPQENDNAGTILSWTRDFDGDERIAEPDLRIYCERCDGEGCPDDDGDGWLTVELGQFMRTHHDAVLTLGLRYSDYGHYAQIYESDDPNCAIVFTQKEIDYEWSGHIDPYPVRRKNPDGSPGEIIEYGGARRYAEGRIKELNYWLRGDVYGIVIRERPEPTVRKPQERGPVLESVWGFIGDPDSDWIRSEARGLARGCAWLIKRERREAYRCACADVVTIG